MSWQLSTDGQRAGHSAPVGLSSGSGNWQLVSDYSSDEVGGVGSVGLSGLGGESAYRVSESGAVDADLSVTVELPRLAWERENLVDLANPPASPLTSVVPPVAEGAASPNRLYLGSGLATRVERSFAAAEAPTRSNPLPVDHPELDGLVPRMEDTQGFLVADVEPVPARADAAGQSRSSDWRRWGLLRTLRRLVGSIASSAEAGGKIVDHAVGLAVGSHATLTSETQKLLHKRLQISTLLLFFGFFASLIAEGFFFSGLHGTAEFLRFWSEVFLTTIMGLVSWRLLANCPHLFRNLRLVEFVVFGSASWILALNSWVLLEQGAAAKHSVSLSGPWQALVFTYALFIPNHWRRALSGIAAMSFAPVLITISASLFSPNVARLAVESMDFSHGIVTLCLMSAFATVTATWGVYTIGSLRSEVFSAKQFGQYRLSRLLGSGGMGEVYVGEHLLLKRPCAIKVIKPQQASDPKMLERFEREVRSTAKLTHWNTVAIYDYGRAEDGTFFYVMEYLPGLNLSQIVKMFGPMPPGRVVHLLVQICDALAEAHHHGMVHRDVKPANIFASKRGSKYDVAKLLDFGLVRRFVSREGTADGSGGAVGSPLYMSPEQVTGRPMDPRSDLYSLGVTAFYLLTGRAPFNDTEPMRVLRAHVKQAPPSFESLGVNVPQDLAAVLMTCLQKQAEDRYSDVECLRRALLECRCAGEWSWHHAAQWWKLHRCPEKSRLDQAIEGDRLADWLAETEVQHETLTEPVPALLSN
jgi:eukaryotic-like serine/threonine-protein kinase